MRSVCSKTYIAKRGREKNIAKSARSSRELKLARVMLELLLTNLVLKQLNYYCLCTVSASGHWPVLRSACSHCSGGSGSGTCRRRSGATTATGGGLTEENFVPATFLEAACTRIDPDQSCVFCQDISAMSGSCDTFRLDYDRLVVAVGARSATFCVPGVEEHAMFLKEIPDAVRIRDRMLDAFETEALQDDPAEKTKLCTFVVVGAGPTGVEFAAELEDHIAEDLAALYPAEARAARVVIVSSTDDLLSSYDKKISARREYFRNAPATISSATSRVRHAVLPVVLRVLEAVAVAAGGAIPGTSRGRTTSSPRPRRTRAGRRARRRRTRPAARPSRCGPPGRSPRSPSPGVSRTSSRRFHTRRGVAEVRPVDPPPPRDPPQATPPGADGPLGRVVGHAGHEGLDRLEAGPPAGLVRLVVGPGDAGARGRGGDPREAPARAGDDRAGRADEEVPPGREGGGVVAVVVDGEDLVAVARGEDRPREVEVPGDGAVTGGGRPARGRGPGRAQGLRGLPAHSHPEKNKRRSRRRPRSFAAFAGAARERGVGRGGGRGGGRRSARVRFFFRYDDDALGSMSPSCLRFFNAIAIADRESRMRSYFFTLFTLF